MFSCRKGVNPSAQFVIAIFAMPHDSSGTVNQKSSDITVSAFADTQQTLLATGTVLAWHKP